MTGLFNVANDIHSQTVQAVMSTGGQVANGQTTNQMGANAAAQASQQQQATVAAAAKTTGVGTKLDILV